MSDSQDQSGGKITTSYPPDRTSDEAVELFQKIESSFPETLGSQRWYLIMIACLCGGAQPQFCANLYSYLISQPAYATSEARKALIKRIREALVKCVSIIGVCRPLEAIFKINEIERPEDKDFSFSRENWQCDAENLERGKDWLHKIYRHNHSSNEKKFEAHQDFAWISYNITYGLYLSDHSILDEIDTELVVLSGILIQNLPSETHWHLRGSRRVGISLEDVEKVHQNCETIAEFCRVRVDKVPRVADIEHEVPW